MPELTSDYQGTEDLLVDLFDDPQEYAGFWLRLAAYVIDVMLFYFVAIVIVLILQFGLSLNTKPSGALEYLFLFLFLVMLSYFPIMESSRWQATLGKRAVGIIVTDLYGQRISFARAAGRFCGKILSTVIIYIGFIMAGFTNKKQGLHDMMARTLVVKSHPIP